jgi:hypothetical protein
MSRFLIGIDLGTTNSALAYIDLQGRHAVGVPKIEHFKVPQLVKPGETAARELLPSFIYIPGQHDLPAGATALPWDPDCAYAVGEFARNHGARVPGRLVTSAKSWLCHAGVDRSAPLLPWSAPPDVPRISPVEASTRYLRHLLEAWNFTMAATNPAERLERQTVVLTVPASFDDVARTLTVEAARKAGIENLTLLEEPQAAFYCWLAMHPAKEAAHIKPGDHCLVVDIGGGTTDFSLIQAIEQEGDLGFLRQAVGDHLLLGGDNMDLALAKSVEAKLPASGRLDAAQYGMLTQACRQAKESLLRPNPPATFAVTVMGRGRQVIGGSLTANLTPDDVRRAIVDGFFPLVPRDAEPERGGRVGLHEMGLPYVSDPAITRHLASFLKRHAPHADDSSSVEWRPAAVLFNGGVFQPALLQIRVVHVLRQWFDTPERPWQPLVLTNPSLDLAVAWGAAHFAWLKHSGGRRIGGGIARSYYVGVQVDADKNPAQTTVLCVVPQHLEEGQEITLAQPELELALGQPVMFPLYTSTVRAEDKAGALLHLAPSQLLQLPPLHTILRGGKRSGTRSVPVTLAARCTEIGTLELFCVSRDGNNRWRLEFNVRDIVKDIDDKGDDGSVAENLLTDVWPEEQVQEAAKLLRAAYAPAPLKLPDSGPDVALKGDPKQITKCLEAILEAGRDKWPTGLCRRLWDFLAEVADQRRASPAHLSRWYNLVGFCLRPGFGDPLDKFRVDQLWKILHAPRPAAANRSGGTAKALAPPEGGADFWIMWRRVAGGLNVQLQNHLLSRLRPVLLPGKGKNVARPGANEVTEMWRAAAALERLDVKHKEQLGQTVLKSCRRGPVPTHAFWSLTRLGARVLLYGPLNAVVHPELVQTWIDTILPFEPTNDSERLAWAFCLTQLARRSGQRALDIDDSHRTGVLAVLRGQSVPGHWPRMVEEVAELEADEQRQMFGEGLPIGLRLARVT